MSLAASIAKLQAAIFRSESQLAALALALGPDMCPCCVGAAYGGTAGPYDTLQDKLERQEVWLDVLLAKQAGDIEELRRASERYGKLTRDRARRSG